MLQKSLHVHFSVPYFNNFVYIVLMSFFVQFTLKENTI